MIKLGQINIIISLYLLITCGFSVQLITTDDVIKQIKYQSVIDYDAYIQKLKSQAGEQNTIQLTRYGTTKQKCNEKQCKFYIFLYQPSNKSKIKYTIFINSGMHGDQLIGPTSLLYAYSLLKPQNARIIYFPITNPSGYVKKTRQTFPDKLDLNRDYPIDNNSNCYRGSATRIIDYLFRKYRIDLTVNLHNGGDNIAWNWGTKQNIQFSHTQDYPIYESIGNMLKYFGGDNKRYQIKQFTIGTMNEVVYPVRGTLDDWAYAGSWSQNTVKSCINYTFQPYPKSMHQSLVFLLELGNKQLSSTRYGTSLGLNKSVDAVDQNNGYVTRTLRMLRALVKVVSPIFMGYFNEGQSLVVKIEGCYKLSNISVIIKNTQTNKKQIKTQKNINILMYSQNTFSYLLQIPLNNKQLITNIQNIIIQYQFICNLQWLNKGKSFLSKSNSISGTLSLNSNSNVSKQMLISQFKSINQNIQSRNNLIFGLGIVGILLILSIGLGCCTKRNNIQFNQQVQELPNIVKSIQQSSSQIIENQDSSQLEKKDDNSLQQMQSKQNVYQSK